MHVEPDLANAAKRNLVGSYCKLADHTASGAVHEIGSVVSFVTGAQRPLFNGCLLVRPASAADVEASMELLDARNLPYQVWLDEGLDTELIDLAVARGLVEDEWVMPGMVLRAPWESPSPPSAIRISQVVDAAAHDTWLGLIADAGMPRDAADHLFPASFAADEDVGLFIAFLGGRPVGTSVAIRTGDVSGVYAVMTLPDARRRGVGTAAAWGVEGADAARVGAAAGRTRAHGIVVA